MATSSRTNKPLKLIAAILIPVLAVSVLSVVSFSGGLAQTEASEKDKTDKSTIDTKSAKQLFEERTAQHFVQTYPTDSGPITISRGATIVVPIAVEHLSWVNDESVTITDFRNEIRNFLPSARADMTDDEFLDYIEDEKNQNKELPGEINVNDFISFSSKKLELAPNATGTIMLTISLPATLPDEIVGMTLDIGIIYDIKDHKSPTVARAGVVNLEVTA